MGRPGRLRGVARSPGGPPELVADATLFRREFGWEPRYSDLDSVVETAWAWLRRWKRLG